MSIPPSALSGIAAVTDGRIAARNLDSARTQAWSRFWRAPEQPGLAAIVVEHEMLTAQFSGDAGALERIETLAAQCERASPRAADTAVVNAQVAGALHRFDEARVHLAHALTRGAPAQSVERISLSLDQATGADPDRVLAARRQRVAGEGRWEEWIPLAALLADLGFVDEAERTYHHALQSYRDVSPFAIAWVCFELGMLWGERVPVPQPALAAAWYRLAIEYLPTYVKARVHLAEILLDAEEIDGARDLLRPALGSADPEVAWRLGVTEAAASNDAVAETWLASARRGFETLLANHLLAFADHGVEFYLAEGNDPVRALTLAKANLSNRPTLRAYELTSEAALAAGDAALAIALGSDATRRWSGIPAFRHSPLAERKHDAVAWNPAMEAATHART